MLDWKQGAQSSVVVEPFCQQPSGQSAGPIQAQVSLAILGKYGLNDLTSISDYQFQKNMLGYIGLKLQTLKTTQNQR